MKKDEVVALKYDGRGAPFITAKGKGDIAKNILKIAQEYNIPLYQDPQLSALLSKVDIGNEVPQELYIAVAQVLKFVFELNQEQNK